MPDQHNHPRESAQSYSSHHTSSQQSYLKESVQSIKQYQDIHVRRDEGLYSKSVYEAPNIAVRSHKKNFQSCFRQDVIIQFYNAYLPLIELQPYLILIEKIYSYYHREVFKNSHDSVILQIFRSYHCRCHRKYRSYWPSQLKQFVRFYLSVI